MSEFFQNLADGLKALKNLSSILDEMREVRLLLGRQTELIAEYVELIGGYTETLRDIKRQLDSIVAKLPFK